MGVNIKMELKETEWKSYEWICLPQYTDQWQAIVNVAKKRRE